jgi:hypothetical protein
VSAAVPGGYPAATMPDISLSPIGDTAAVAALLWAVWHERASKKDLPRHHDDVMPRSRA